MSVDFVLSGRVFAAVLFDLDGTLIDSTEMVDLSWTRWATEYGLTGPQFWRGRGLPARTIVQRAVDAGRLRPDEIDAAVARIEQIEIEAAVNGSIPVLPGAAAALAALPPGRAAIVTSCTTPLAAARIGATDLTSPAVTVTADQLARGKPDPEGFLRASAALGFDPRSCLVVEDAPAGLAAGRAAGCALLGLTTTTEPGELLSADAVVGTLAEVTFVAGPDGVRVHPNADR